MNQPCKIIWERAITAHLQGTCITIPNINELGFMYDRNIKQFFEGKFWYDATK